MASNSISLSWSVSFSSSFPRDPEDDVSEVTWRVFTGSGEGTTSGSSGSLSSTSYSVEGLEHSTVYDVTVTVNTVSLGSYTKSFIGKATTNTLHSYAYLTTTVPETRCESRSDSSAAAIVGGVSAVVIVILAVVLVMGIVVGRYRGAWNSTEISLSDSEKFQTTNNEAYNLEHSTGKARR
jgi:hypothetical protein